ncbi:hypothetical protein DTG75_23345, partial [Salmonella enterica subsp. salamae]|nr:hypothetical protein [Salmonella enterica subsp. salamae]
KNRFVFIVTTIIFGILFVLFLFFGLYILEQIPQFAFVVRKINFYLEQNPTILQLGWLNLFVLIYTVAYVFFSYSIERNSNANLLNRFIFVGSIIFIFSGTFPFLGRMTLYFIFIALYIISDPKKNWRIGNAIVVNGYFSIFLVLNFSSYFRNDLAPVDFDNLNYCFLNLFDNNYMQKIATENLPEMLVGE